MIKFKSVFLVLLTVGCGSTDGCNGCEKRPAKRERTAAAHVDAGSTAPQEPARAPCAYVPPDVLERWPAAEQEALEGIRRWNPAYQLGGPECPVRLGFNDRVRWAKTAVAPDACVIGLNPNSPIVDTDPCLATGDWSERQMRLIDLVTHEWGHCAGLKERRGGERGCAMCAHPHCEAVFPNPDEIEAAGL